MNKKHKTPRVSNLNHVKMLRPNFLPLFYPLCACLRFRGMKTANFRPKFAASLSNQWIIRENMCLLLIGTFSLACIRAQIWYHSIFRQVKTRNSHFLIYEHLLQGIGIVFLIRFQGKLLLFNQKIHSQSKISLFS